jgi:ferredoxin
MNSSTRKEQAMYRIEVDRQLCSGFGSCIDAAPQVFELDSSGIASLLVSESADRVALAAARSCPMGAIAVFDSENGKQVS